MTVVVNLFLAECDEFILCCSSLIVLVRLKRMKVDFLRLSFVVILAESADRSLCTMCKM